MPTRPLERLLFLQGGRCFFCERALSPGDASVEHLVAKANGGNNGEDNCVACCKALNALFGKIALKDKLQAILKQKGDFRCPEGEGDLGSPVKVKQAKPTESKRARLKRIKKNFQKRGITRPRTMNTLGTTINALFKNALTAPEITALIRDLQSQRFIFVVDNKVSYEPPKATPN